MTTNINIRVDSDDKLYFENFCKNTGMNITCAINMFIKNVIKEGRLPFIVEEDPFYSIENQVALEKSFNDYKKGKLTTHDIVEV